MSPLLKPALVLPFHDPRAAYFPHLQAITPQLESIFSRAFLSISPPTQQKQAAMLQALAQNPFFHLTSNRHDSLPGNHYRAAYHSAVSHCRPEQILHLCDVDKLVCYLQGDDREVFIADLQAAGGDAPLLFQRSPAAWTTYPRHYREIESLAINLGQYRFGRYLDIAWSHLVIRAGHLATLLPQLQSRDFGLLAEMILLLQAELKTKDVDWLVWEDPFIEGRDPANLCLERDRSPEETTKRLRWLKPILLQLLKAID